MEGTVEFDSRTHTYTVDGKPVPSVTTILSLVTSGHYKSISPEVLRAAAERGTEVHRLTEDYDMGLGPEEMAAEVAPYFLAYLRFLRDHKVEWLGSEKQVHYYDEFAGTVDRYGDIDGEPCVVDIKTYAQPSAEQYLALCGQTAAYEIALYGDIVGCKHYGLFLRKDGTYRLVDCAEYEKKYKVSGLKLFTACLEFYRKMEEWKANGKRNSGNK